MGKNIVIVVVLCCLAVPKIIFCDELSWQDLGGGNTDIQTVFVYPDDAELMFFGSNKGLYRSGDSGESWKNVLLVKGQGKSVNFVTFCPNNPKSIFVATSRGLYRSNDLGVGWQRIFKGKSGLEADCVAVLALPECIYLGTSNGLFISKDNGRLWQKDKGRLGKSKIFNMVSGAKDDNAVYVACDKGVYKSKADIQEWTRVFVDIPGEEDSADIEVDEQDESQINSDVRYLAVDPDNGCLYLATKYGIYRSLNRGESWEKFTDYGLLSKEVDYLAISDSSGLYAMTKSGIFVFKTERWHEMSLSLPARSINSISLDKNGNLYAACDKGLFVLCDKIESKHTEGIAVISDYGKNEPDIREVQQEAIEYAEVQPEKILRWRSQAAKKALLPQLNVGAGRNTTDLWHWEGGSTTKPDDDTLRKGKDSLDWDISLMWDLSELIWNNDQTSIDTRSRLLVQLREDILDEVTKYYFERIRIKMEVDNLSIEEKKKRQEKELRLQELTAYLDALTGGHFSKRVIELSPVS